MRETQQSGSYRTPAFAARWLRRLLNLTIPLLVTAALLIGAELIARRLGVVTGYFMIPQPWNCLQRSASLGMEYAPNCSGVSGIEKTRFTTNSLGLRDDEVLDDGARRILCVGDSSTWGWAVDQQDAYPQLLERELDQRVGRGSYRVINAGRPGFTSYQGLRYLHDGGLGLKPTVVILGFGFNDLIRRGDIEAELQWYGRALPFLLVDDWLIARSTLWRWLRRRVERPAPTNLPSSTSPEQYQDYVTQMVRLIREHGAKPLIINFWGTPKKSFPHLDALRRVADDEHVSLVDYDGPRLDVIHPTAEGYRQLTRAVAERLQGEAYVGSAADLHRR